MEFQAKIDQNKPTIKEKMFIHEKNGKTQSIARLSIIRQKKSRLLGCRIGRTATKRVQLIARRKLIAKPEIGDLYVHITIEQQILGLQIAMHDMLLVQILHGRHDLPKFGTRLLLLHSAMCDQIVEDFAPAGILHDQVESLLGLYDLE